MQLAPQQRLRLRLRLRLLSLRSFNVAAAGLHVGARRGDWADRRCSRAAGALAGFGQGQQPPLPSEAAPAVAATAPPQQQPLQRTPPTRLQQQLKDLIAIDVECAHFRAPGQSRVLHLPAEVCLVDAQRNTVLRSHCNPLSSGQADWQFVGGVPVAEWEGAPALEAVRAQVAAAIEGRLLVGHNLPQDLATLGLSHPRELQRDTMRYRQLQTGRRRGQRLSALSEQKLGRRIQEAGRRHDPREDALAALDLYVQHVHLDPAGMEYSDLVEHHLAQILASAGSVDVESSGGSMDSSASSADGGADSGADEATGT